MRRFTDFTGTYKITTVVGFQEFAKVLGKNDDLA